VEPETPYLTVSEAATRLRCEPSTIRKWIRQRRLHAVRTPGGRILIDPRDVLLALDAPYPRKGPA